MVTVTGTAGDDLLQGTGGDDLLLAGAGRDTVDGGAGNDRVVIDRSAATDPITLYMLAPALTGLLAGTRVSGVEHLSFTGGSGDDGIVGGAGDDSLAGGAGADALQGGLGADALLGGDGADTLLGGPGADLLIGGSGADRFILQGSGGVDGSLAAPDRFLDFNAAEGDRLVLRGEAIGAGLLALGGRAFGLAGEPILPVGFCGSLTPAAVPSAGQALPDPTGGGAFRLYWQPDLVAGGWLLLDADRDGLLGSADLVVRIDLAAGLSIAADSFLAGSFAILGSITADALAGTAAADSLLGFEGNDTLAGLDGDDTLLGGSGDDSLAGGAGFDSLLGGDGADTLDGNADTDVLDGGAGADVLRGGLGDDLLIGGAGADWLQGNEGDDSLQGGFGADTLEGGAGADTLLLQGMGEAAWSNLAGMDVVTGFSHADGDRLRLSDAWFGRADGGGADAGTYTGLDGIARALVFSGSTGRSVAAPTAGLALPAQALDAYQVYWVPGMAGGGWLALDLDRNGQLDATDLVVRLDGVASLTPEDFVAGTYLTLSGGFVRGGTAGNDTLTGGALAETFLGSPGSDRITGGPGAGNALSYAGLSGPIAVTVNGYATGSVAKPGGTSDSFAGIQVLAGTDGTDTLDAAAAGTGFFTLSLEGRGGADLIIGNGGLGVQVSYAASPAAISLDLMAGTGLDGWGTTDTLLTIRRVAATSAFGDTVMGSAWDDIFISGTFGNKTFDGRVGSDEWRYAGTGAISAVLAPSTVGGFAQGAYVLKPGGTDRLTAIEAIAGGAGNDSLVGSAGDDRLGGGAGNDTMDGGAGIDIAWYDVGGLATRGVVVNLATGTAADQWGGTDVLRRIESAWGTPLGDDLTGLAVAGTYTWLRGLAGNDTLRAPTAGTLVGADHAGDPAAILAELGTGTVRDGWGGFDTLVGIAVIRGSEFNDRITGGTGVETLFGGGGDDTLDGGGGADRLEGGPGNDAFLVDDAGESVWEAPGEGSDTITAAVGFTLPGNVEVLVLAEAAGGASAFGNPLDNLIAGNAGANVMDGGAGQDTLLGGAGADSLYGGTGDDLVDGGAGNDYVVGGTGADTLLGGDGDDIAIADADGSFTGTLLLGTGEAVPRALLLVAAATFADTYDGGPGYDRWYSNAVGLLLDLRARPLAMSSVEEFNGSASDDALLLAAAQPAATVNGGAGNDTVSGTAAGDRLDGGDGDDLLAGQEGNDTLYGGTGDDTLLGGAGNDALYGQSGHGSFDGGPGDDTLYSTDLDTVLEGGEGDDLAQIDRAGSLRGLRLGPSNLTDGITATSLHGVERLAVTAGSGADTLVGGAWADTLAGGAGGDWLDGGGGANVLDGGVGDDTLLSAAWDLTLEGGEGDDLAQLDRGDSLRGLRLGPASLTDGLATTALSGIEHVLAIGGAGADTLVGGAGADTLLGGAGADSLDGGGGANVLDGGTGDDTLVSAGWDDVLDGGDGEDFARIDRSGSLRGLSLGLSTLTDGVATTTLRGIEHLAVTAGTGADTLAGGAAADTLRGGAGADYLDGGAGGDWLYGGAGDDTFLVDNAADQVVEASGEGRDTVIAAVGFNLGGNVEGLTLAAGAGDIFGVGNELSNVIIGNEGDNLMVGGGGNDTLDGGVGDDVLFGGATADSLIGGAGMDKLFGGGGADTLDGAGGTGEADLLDGGLGDDTYRVDAAGDLIFEASGGGSDTVLAAIAGTGYRLPANVEALVLLGNTPFGIGNALANTLTGSDAGNLLLGGAGNDTLEGRGGDDVLFGEAGIDTFVQRPGGGQEVIGDFAVGVDHLKLLGLGFGSLAQVLAATTQTSAGAVIHAADGGSITLAGVAKSTLVAGDFLFV